MTIPAAPPPEAPPPAVPPPPAAAATVFGDRLDRAEAYAARLAADAVIRGLVGPQEAARLWERHLLNCAVVAERIPDGVPVTDVGSGAGLPGIPLALARPDLQVTLLEPMARRVTFLEEVLAALDLADRVTVVRARAEEARGRVAPARVVTARALAPLGRLAAWCLPLTAPGGRVVAIKGASAATEVAADAAVVRRLGGGAPAVRQCGVGLVDPATTIIEFPRVR